MAPISTSRPFGMGRVRKWLFLTALRPSHQLPSSPLFSSAPPGCRLCSRKFQKRSRISSTLCMTWGKSKAEWYSIPIGVGIGVLGLVQAYKIHKHATESKDDEQFNKKPARRPRPRLDGPWQVQAMSVLPLKALSRLWGTFNEVDIPYCLRRPGFKLYSYIFGVNLDEVYESDLHAYPNLAAFFYRTLKPGVRPLDPNPAALLSPSDGTILQFGQIQGGDIEQVKGVNYSLDALLGKNTPAPSTSRPDTKVPAAEGALPRGEKYKGAEILRQDEEFARLNGISYTLSSLLSGPAIDRDRKQQSNDQSTAASPTSVSDVRADLALCDRPWYDLMSKENPTSLYYAVIYLCPGDYHRFHSPTNWVVERRRHFAGELFSVSPYLQRTLPGLFTLNERVVLLGRWRWGFFSFVPVGATNVGSIKINFDCELQTNSLTTDTAADKAAEEAASRGEAYTGFSEANYEMASPVLHGHALRRGEEIGGFQLGSTIVLVFEAPLGKEDEGGKAKGGWDWLVKKGQKVKMGQALGRVDEE